MLRLTVICVTLSFFLSGAWAENPKVVLEIESLNSMRESLVQKVKPPVGLKQFKAACGPVGKGAKAIAIKNKWKVRQASHKFRNPKNKASKIEQEAILVFQKDSNRKSFWKDVAGGTYYFRRIDTKAACLMCHGPKESRPEFVKAKYPKDKAFGFKIGELRGIYSVFVPQ